MLDLTSFFFCGGKIVRVLVDWCSSNQGTAQIGLAI